MPIHIWNAEYRCYTQHHWAMCSFTGITMGQLTVVIATESSRIDLCRFKYSYRTNTYTTVCTRMPMESSWCQTESAVNESFVYEPISMVQGNGLKLPIAIQPFGMCLRWLGWFFVSCLLLPRSLHLISILCVSALYKQQNNRTFSVFALLAFVLLLPMSSYMFLYIYQCRSGCFFFNSPGVWRISIPMTKWKILRMRQWDNKCYCYRQILSR